MDGGSDLLRQIDIGRLTAKHIIAIYGVRALGERIYASLTDVFVTSMVISNHDMACWLARRFLRIDWNGLSTDYSGSSSSSTIQSSGLESNALRALYRICSRTRNWTTPFRFYNVYNNMQGGPKK